MMKAFEDLLSGVDTPMPKPIKESTGEKGLLNYIGENNCFLNVVIQSLWHLDSFRLKFTSEKELHRHQEHCVYCSLEVIFTQFEFSEESRLPPTILRETMAIIFKPKMKFQLYELDDASEAFDAVLHCLHSQLVDERSLHSLNQCKDTNCVAHKVFGINTVEQIKCGKCGTKSDEIRTQLFTVYTYSALLRDLYNNNVNSNLSFCQFLKIASEEDKRPCPNREKCKAMCPISHELLSLPEVFTVSIAWDTDVPNLSDIRTILQLISMSIDIANIFDLSPKLPKQSYPYRLRGMICYYGKHYIAFFYNHIRKQWFYFDDSNVKAVGSEWLDIQERCIRGRLQPSVLFYESEVPHNQIPSSVTDKDGMHLSHIKISAVVPTIEEDPMTATVLLDSPRPSYALPCDTDPEQSFIVIPSPNKIELNGDIDFVVTRTNWMYRRQMRIFRFTDDCFKRIVPSSGAEKHIFDYQDVLDVTIIDSNNIIITFYSGKEAQYIQSDKALDIVEVLKYKSSLKNHSFKLLKLQ